MALTECWECGEQVSTAAETCPNCGAPDPAPETPDGETLNGVCYGCGQEIEIKEGETCPHCDLHLPLTERPITGGGKSTSESSSSSSSSGDSRSRARRLVEAIFVVALIGGAIAYFGGSDSQKGSSATETGDASSASKIREGPLPAAVRESVKERVTESFGTEADQMGFRRDFLRVEENPHGAGVFICSSRTEFAGFTRIPLWVTYGGQLYALNGPAHTISDGNIPWGYPRTGTEEAWQPTGLLPDPIEKGITVCYPDY